MTRICLPCFSTLTVLLTLPLIATSGQARIQAPVTENLVCPSPSFGLPQPSPPNRPGNPLWSRCSGVRTQNPSQTELFWAPAWRLRNNTGTCRNSGGKSASVPSTIRVFTLFNIDPSRTLTVNGSNADEILIGSPGTSDALQGNGGKNTYVIGGLNASVRVIPPDRLQVISSSTESDYISFGDDTEYVYINPGSNGQGNPGSVDPINPGTITTPSGANVPIRGSDALGPFRPAPDSCESFAPWFQPPGAPRFPLLAQAHASDHPRGPWPASQPLGLISRWDPSPPDVRRLPGVPGAPTLVGFGLTDDNRDQIILPSADFRFQDQPILEAFPPGEPIPVLLVDRGRFLPPRVVSPETQKRLQNQSRGMRSIRSRVAPLVYFRQNGLLVLSQNSQPLGSSDNPGVVIAVLRDRQGRPVELPSSGEAPLYLSRFLSFAPPKSNPDQNDIR